MPKLNQIIAIQAGKKSQAGKTITEAYQTLQKGGLLEGISRTYKPKDDDGEHLPPEKKQVQLRVREAIKGVVESLTELFDIVATQDQANCLAKADVVDYRFALDGASRESYEKALLVFHRVLAHASGWLRQ